MLRTCGLETRMYSMFLVVAYAMLAMLAGLREVSASFLLLALLERLHLGTRRRGLLRARRLVLLLVLGNWTRR